LFANAVLHRGGVARRPVTPLDRGELILVARHQALRFRELGLPRGELGLQRLAARFELGTLLFQHLPLRTQGLGVALHQSRFGAARDDEQQQDSPKSAEDGVKEREPDGFEFALAPSSHGQSSGGLRKEPRVACASRQ